MSADACNATSHQMLSTRLHTDISMSVFITVDVSVSVFMQCADWMRAGVTWMWCGVYIHVCLHDSVCWLLEEWYSVLWLCMDAPLSSLRNVWINGPELASQRFPLTQTESSASNILSDSASERDMNKGYSEWSVSQMFLFLLCSQHWTTPEGASDQNGGLENSRSAPKSYRVPAMVQPQGTKQACCHRTPGTAGLLQSFGNASQIMIILILVIISIVA